MFIVDPLRKYQVNGEVAQLQTANIALAAGLNQLIVTAVTGKRIRCMGWKAQGNAAGFPSISFKSASGGTVLTPHIYVPNNAAGLTNDLPVTDSGYFETLTGEGLYADINVANLNILVFYIIYKPT